jgi:hypothetical protein
MRVLRGSRVPNFDASINKREFERNGIIRLLVLHNPRLLKAISWDMWSLRAPSPIPGLPGPPEPDPQPDARPKPEPDPFPGPGTGPDTWPTPDPGEPPGM